LVICGIIILVHGIETDDVNSGFALVQLTTTLTGHIKEGLMGQGLRYAILGQG
jgi:hypothetical protein